MIKKMLIGFGLLATTTLSGCVVYASPPTLAFRPACAVYPIHPAYPTAIYFTGFRWGYHGFCGVQR